MNPKILQSLLDALAARCRRVRGPPA